MSSIPIHSSPRFGPTVVMVDDSASALAHLAALVRENIPDCQARTFTDPAAALGFCLEADIELVVVDYLMPTLNGLQFIERLRQAPSALMVPIIMVTTEEAMDLRYMALQLGATDFLRKPVDSIEFVTRTRNLLQLSRSQRLLAERNDRLDAEVRKATRSLLDREREAIHVLSRAAEYRDPETAAHLVRMAEYSRIIARGLGLPEEEQNLIHAAAPMHDIGKIGIPDDILLKPGPLDREEMEIMRRHTLYGWEILSPCSSPLLQLAAQIAISHHERYDGSGYPAGLAGDDIPLCGRITALADVFDALTSVRPYKRSWTMEEARTHIHRNRGAFFDPACVDVFFASWQSVTETAARQRSGVGSDASQER